MTARRHWLHFGSASVARFGLPALAGLAALLIGLAGPRSPAAEAKTAAKPAREARAVIDVSSYRDELLALTDGTVYYVVRPEPFSERVAFVGDGTTFYRQHDTSGSADGTTGSWSTSLRSSRTPSGTAEIAYADKKYQLHCGQVGLTGSTTTALTLLDKEARTTLLASATFYDVYWQRGARSLARDDAGTYYYVDEILGEYGGNGYRVFIGKRGALKEMKMTSVVADSAGDIFSTKSGELRFVTGTDRTATWIKGKKKTALTFLPVGDNLRLIYRDFGIYGFLGMACEDM